MKRFSEHAFEMPVGLNRLFAAIAFVAVAISMAPGKVRGQTTACNELVADMAAQQKMIGTFGTLDYQIREHFLLVANAILSTYGGWNSKEGWASNVAQLRDSDGEYKQELSTIQRNIKRDKATSEEELQRLNDVIKAYLELIETGDRIAREIDAGRVDKANRIYYETARTSYVQVHGELYTLIVTAERRVASMARTPCS